MHAMNDDTPRIAMYDNEGRKIRQLDLIATDDPNVWKLSEPYTATADEYIVAAIHGMERPQPMIVKEGTTLTEMRLVL